MKKTNAATESTAAAGRQLTFRVLGREPVTGTVKNPDATLGKVAAKVAAKLGIAGAFECVNAKQETISPQTRLVDLPDEEITLASDLTPAQGRWV